MSSFIEIAPGRIQEVSLDPEGKIEELRGWEPYTIVKEANGYPCSYDLPSLTTRAAIAIFGGGLGKKFGEYISDFANSNETKRIYSAIDVNGDGEATLIKIDGQIIITFKEVEKKKERFYTIVEDGNKSVH